VTVLTEAYPSCYNEQETCFDITFTGNRNIGTSPKISFEVIGIEADVEAYRVSGRFTVNSLNPNLKAGELTHSILSPASAPCVICVGATAYRPSFINYKGQLQVNNNGTGGIRSPVSAVGPTYDGRTKPDVMAPGINVISSYSSYYMENHPDARDLNSDVKHFDFGQRTYAWNSNSGTSMSAPAVAGIIALWLEACPTLTTDEILGVLERTSRHYDPDLDYPNNLYGYGEIDAYRGLLDILRVNKIEGVSSHPTKAHVAVNNGALEVHLPSAPSVSSTVSVYSLSGRLIARHRMPVGSSSCRLPLPSVRRGDVSIVQIDGDATYSGSMLVR
jgi:subtilisin family serine protease